MKTFLVVLLAALFVQELHGQGDWPAYGYDQNGQRHSPLTQIDVNNVSKCQVGVAVRYD